MVLQLCSCLSTWLMGIASLLIGAYFILQYRFTYWTRKGFPQLPTTFPSGNASGLGRKRALFQIVRDVHVSVKEKIIGMYLFWRPLLVVREPELIKAILIKDFSYFHDRGFFSNIDIDPLTGHLFFLKGSHWRNIRIKLTPTFTSGKMKMMYPIILDCGDGLKKALQPFADKKETIELKKFLSGFTMNIIASCAFGLDLHALENPNSEFSRVSDFLLRPSFLQSVKNTLAFSAPQITKLLQLRVVPEQVQDFFIGTVQDTMTYREKNNVVRNDFLQLLLMLKQKGKVEDSEVYRHDELEERDGHDHKFTIKEATAQAFVFFIAGFETASTAMQFTLYELAKNQNIQDKLREELDNALAKNGGKFSYEGIQECEYLEKVIAETLRLYPPAPLIVRECTKAYRFQDTGRLIERGTGVMISVLALHHDPEVFPNPEKFDPERFTPEEKAKRHPMSYIPFGEGPRICIGQRFALMEIKVGLSVFLSNYKVSISEKTPKEIKLNPKSVLTSLESDMYLKVERR